MKKAMREMFVFVELASDERTGKAAQYVWYAFTTESFITFNMDGRVKNVCCFF